MKTGKLTVLAALFYPLVLSNLAVGFLAFVMILAKLDPLFISTAILWFYFTCVTSIYLVSERALKTFGVHRIFLCLMLVIGTLSIISTLLLLLR
ncbi:MAG: hypothetical protein DRN83_01225 [Hadesarchaea archaeon]|nr:MAG: hypothetical protein DRN83_01225 [Hadesarchaea archaeon]HDI12912.1 hypothetical protein [Hadesarchaea archaeon]